MSEPAVIGGRSCSRQTPLLDRYEGDLHHTLELDIGLREQSSARR